MREPDVENSDEKRLRPPPVVGSADPQTELEERLRKHPHDSDAKVDVGSDESMDASDPPSAVQPGHNDPVPSSGAPQDE
jgi:hypothetical protein